MPYTIAVTGKGGTGKTTIAALLTVNLIRNGFKPVLAVDADPNSCLDSALGTKVQNTVGRLREKALEISNANPTASKKELLELKISESLVEGENFDLIAMGRPEGPGCYCYANNILREVLGTVTKSYPYTVIDNEAGLENLSRRLVTSVDLLLIAGDTSRNGLETIKRVFALSKEMGVNYNQLGIIVNMIKDTDIENKIEELRSELSPGFIQPLPYSSELHQLNEKGCSLFTLPPDNKVNSIISELLRKEVPFSWK